VPIQFQRANPYVDAIGRDDQPRNIRLVFLDENRSAGNIARAAEPTQLATCRIPFVSCTGYVDTDEFRTKCSHRKIVHEPATPQMLVSAIAEILGCTAPPPRYIRRRLMLSSLTLPYTAYCKTAADRCEI